MVQKTRAGGQESRSTKRQQGAERRRAGEQETERAGEQERESSRAREQESRRTAGKVKTPYFQTNKDEEKARYEEKRLFTHPHKLHFTQARFSS